MPETLRDMLNDQEFQRAQKELAEKGQKALTKAERKKRQRALDDLGVEPFLEKVKNLQRDSVQVFQINVGLYCNQVHE